MSTRAPVAETLARARAMTSAAVGLATASTSNPRRYSWSDCPARAARAASSSRTSGGTSRTVTATPIICILASRHAFCSGGSSVGRARDPRGLGLTDRPGGRWRMADQGTGRPRPAGWKKDPSGRHFGRWWDGQKWTENVISAEKVQSLDPLPPQPEDQRQARAQPESPPTRPAAPAAAPTKVMPAAPTIRGPMPTAPGWKPEARSRGPVRQRPIDPADPRGRGENQVLTAIRAWPAWAKWAAGAAVVVVLIATVASSGEDGDQPINVVGQVETTIPLPATTMTPTTQLVTTIPVTQATTTVTTPATTSAPATTPVTAPATTAATPPPTTAVYYANCTAVRAAGKAPIYRGQPGYRAALDADSDGIACET